MSRLAGTLGLALGDERSRREPPLSAVEVADCDCLRVGGGDAVTGGGPELHLCDIGTKGSEPE